MRHSEYTPQGPENYPHRSKHALFKNELLHLFPHPLSSFSSLGGTGGQGQNRKHIPCANKGNAVGRTDDTLL